jgi:hypothetical protein
VIAGIRRADDLEGEAVLATARIIGQIADEVPVRLGIDRAAAAATNCVLARLRDIP